MKTFTLIFATIFVSLLTGCTSTEVEDVSISIKPYHENDRGKFWEICIDYESFNTSERPSFYFEIHDLNGSTREYAVGYIHLKEKCNWKNVLVSFTNRQTPHEEWEWLKSLNPEDIDYVTVRVKNEEGEVLFSKDIHSKDLQ